GRPAPPAARAVPGAARGHRADQPRRADVVRAQGLRQLRRAPPRRPGGVLVRRAARGAGGAGRGGAGALLPAALRRGARVAGGAPGHRPRLGRDRRDRHRRLPAGRPGPAGGPAAV
ncbi:MAG: YjbR family protein, partial [uncultured Pseudonocardia sp.]